MTFTGSADSANLDEDGQWQQDGLTRAVTITPLHAASTLPACGNYSHREECNDVYFIGTARTTPPPGNVDPAVTILAVGGNAVAALSSAHLIAHATDFPDTDTTYTWSNDSGSSDRFNSASNSKVFWMAPADEGEHEISVTASAGNESPSRSITINAPSACAAVDRSKNCYLISNLVGLQAMESDLPGHSILINDIIASNAGLVPSGKAAGPSTLTVILSRACSSAEIIRSVASTAAMNRQRVWDSSA